MADILLARACTQYDAMEVEAEQDIYLPNDFGVLEVSRPLG